MAGINYGDTFTMRHGKKQRLAMKVGVSFSDFSGKWIVRIAGRMNKISSVAQFDTKQEAENKYEELLKHK